MAAFAITSTRVAVTGSVMHPGSYSLADLQALPSITQTVSFSSGGVSQTHSYTSASLQSVLDTAGVVVDPAIKNNVLNKYVLATGADGYRTVFSLGELSPSFGNRPDQIADAEPTTGVSAPLASDGVARITAPGDVKGGRYVSNLVDSKSMAQILLVRPGHRQARTDPTTQPQSLRRWRCAGP